ncbi:MAG: ABC transporter permease [Spirochaetaceae bacterium]|jgi:spermidine/putrescine transport system permease protein|nr:ABC transporter permease [Spirochaetaceae bacterium]
MKRFFTAAEKFYLGLVLFLMYVPILLVIVYSFNASRISSVWSGFSLRWYIEMFRDRALFEALRNSLVLGTGASFAAAAIGALAATGMSRARLPGGKVMEFLAILPIMTPEIILAMVSLAFFSLLALPFGMLTLMIAHTAMCIPYPYLLVKARLEGLDPSFVEAARVMGAGEWRAFYDITLPLIMPAVVSGILISFAMSFDDVIISVFVTGVETNTLPVRIYTQMKFGVTPKINALCTLLFAATAALALLSARLALPRRADRKAKRAARRTESISIPLKGEAA